MRAPFLFLLLAAAAAAAAAASSSPAALDVVLSGKGVTSVVNRSLPPLISSLQGLTLPAVEGEKHIAVIGDVTYALTDLELKSVEAGPVTVSLANGVSVAVSGLEVKLSGAFKVRQKDWPHLETDGTVDVSMSDSHMDIDVATSDAGGKLAVGARSIAVSLENVSISVHGSILSWLYDLIADIVKGDITHKVEDAIQSELAKLINQTAEQALAGVNYTVPLAGGAAVADFSLAAAPAFPDDYMVVPSVAAIEPAGGPAPPLQHDALPVSAPPDRLLGLFLSPYVLNSGFYTAMKAGAFEFPPVTSPKLVTNSTVFALLAPGLAKAFPNAPLRVQPRVFTPPTVSVTANGSAVLVETELAFDAGVGGGQWKGAFVAGANLTAQALFSASNGNATATPYLSASVHYLDVTLATYSTAVGPLSLSLVQGLLKTLLLDPIVKFLNGVLSRGIPLPALPGLSFVDPLVVEQEGYLYIGTDF